MSVTRLICDVSEVVSDSSLSRRVWPHERGHTDSLRLIEVPPRLATRRDDDAAQYSKCCSD